jgi:sensor histidine kinase regulating citrate/malate metabolism
MESAFRNRPDEEDDDDSSTSSRSVLSSHEEDSDIMGIAAADGTVEQASRAVVRSRKLVWCVFVLATLACSISTYFFVKRSEYNTFRLQVSSICALLVTYWFALMQFANGIPHSFIFWRPRLQNFRNKKPST